MAEETSPRLAPTTPVVFPDSQLNHCVSLFYDEINKTITLQQGPLIGWYLDMANLTLPSVPVIMGNIPIQPASPPNPCPQFVIVYDTMQAYALDFSNRVIFSGTFVECLSWLAGTGWRLIPQLTRKLNDVFNQWLANR